MFAASSRASLVGSHPVSSQRRHSRLVGGRCPKPSRATPARAAPEDAPLSAFAPGDLLELDFARAFDPDVSDSDSGSAPRVSAARALLRRAWFLEVTSVAPDGGSLVGLSRGAAFALAPEPSAGGALVLSPAPDDAQPHLARQRWVRDAFPEWSSLLADLESDGVYPRPAEAALAAAADAPRGTPIGTLTAPPTKITSYDALRREVAADPSFWRDGTPANAPPATPATQATLNAGEILAFLVGARGVVMTQLWVGWNGDEDPDSDAAAQPVDAPFVHRALREMAGEIRTGDVGVSECGISGAAMYKGLTATARAEKSPWKERAAHLASFGAQAALVAGSPYYQLLVGSILGYAPQNIEAHVVEKGGVLSPAVAAEAKRDLAALSPEEATLPWREGYGANESSLASDAEGTEGRRGRRGKKRRKSTSRSVADVEAMFGGRRK